MENKKLKFVKEQNTSSDVRFFFAGKRTYNKGNKVHLKYAINPSKLARKQFQDQRSLGVGVNHGLHTRAGIGLYPVPTGRILRRYAQEHDLLPISKIDRKTMDQLPLSLKGILNNPRPIQKKIRPEDMAKMTYDQIIINRKDRYMDPFADSDRDGVVNMADCRPLNKNKQDYEFDKYGNTLPAPERKQKEEVFFPIKNAKNTVNVESKKQEVETEEDQIGWDDGEGDEDASDNITKITKKWKSNKN